MEQDENIKNINLQLTNLILNIDQNYIKHFLNMDYCNKELIILKNKINNQCTEEEIKSFSKYININTSDNSLVISKYYVKLMHIFATIFNITSKNINIINNTLNIPFDISNCLPDIRYAYKTKYDYQNEKYILNDEDEDYNNDLKFFCLFFLKTKKKMHYFNININNVRDEKLNENKMIFESYFKQYTFYLTLMVQNIKKIHCSLLKLINKYFSFENEDGIYYIKNIITMKEIDILIQNIRDQIIEYFFNIENNYKNTIHFFKLTIIHKFYKTIINRIKLLN
tara:strand:+ start:1393 stop:2238 length:846 start_codon:yes stop_codon:yes gene_type:complete